MTSYAESLRQHARIAILRFCEAAPDYTTNVSLLADQLPNIGITFSRDQVISELHWLRDQGFVTLKEFEGFVTVRATQRGVDIALGKARHPEIKRPRPGE